MFTHNDSVMFNFDRDCDGDDIGKLVLHLTVVWTVLHIHRQKLFLFEFDQLCQLFQKLNGAKLPCIIVAHWYIQSLFLD